MIITLQLTPDEEKALIHAAATEGKDVDTFIRQRVFSIAPNLPTIDDLDFLQRNGMDAIRSARKSLLAQGIDFVYRRSDGVIVRHLPDGTEEPLLIHGE